MAFVSSVALPVRSLQLWRISLLVVLVGLLLGCATGTTVEMETLQTLISGKGSGTPAIPSNPDPRYRYLVGAVKGSRPAMLVLAYVDAHPQGPVEVWASATGEMVKLQNGRIIATAGLKSDLLAVRMKSPPLAWDRLTEQGQRFERERDVMPGYRFNMLEQLHVVPWKQQPLHDLPSTLPKDSALRYRWFREVSEVTSGNGLPDAWFAWGKHLGEWSVVYTEQCLAPDYCLWLQRWPVKEEAN